MLRLDRPYRDDLPLDLPYGATSCSLPTLTFQLLPYYILAPTLLQNCSVHSFVQNVPPNFEKKTEKTRQQQSPNLPLNPRRYPFLDNSLEENILETVPTPRKNYRGDVVLIYVCPPDSGSAPAY